MLFFFIIIYNNNKYVHSLNSFSVVNVWLFPAIKTTTTTTTPTILNIKNRKKEKTEFKQNHSIDKNIFTQQDGVSFHFIFAYCFFFVYLLFILLKIDDPVLLVSQ